MSRRAPAMSIASLLPAALVAAFFALAPVALADDPGHAPEGKVIRAIEIDAPPGADLARIRETLRIREGDLYRAAAVQSDIASLYGLGDFSSIEADPQPLDNGLRLVIRLKVRPRVKAVRFEGRTALSEDTLRDLLHTAVGAVAGPYSLKLDAEALRAHYADEGYPFADIHQDIRVGDDGVEIVYAIEAGPRVRVESLRFVGNSAISDDALLKVMISVRKGSLFTRGKYDPALFRSDLLAIRELFRRRGYFDATVGYETTFDEAKERVYVVIRVQQGPLYRLQRLILRGAEVLPAAEILAAIQLKEGAPFSLDQLDSDIEAIRALYGKRGYIKADVAVDRIFAEKEPLATLTLTVREGEQFRVRKVLIRGNLRTQDHVARREVALLPGEIAATDGLEETKRRLLNTGLFFSSDPARAEEPVAIRFLDTGEPGATDVLVDLVEGGVGDFSLGGGISSSLGLVGNLRLTYRNFDATDFPRSWRELLRGDAFTGGGQSLTLSLTPGTEFRDYRLSWLNPSVWDSPYSVGFDLYIRDFSWGNYYDESRVGAGVSVGRTFMKDLHVTLTPRVERIRISNLDGSAPPDAFKAKGTHNRRSLSLNAAYDKRDNIFLTTRGYKLGAGAELAGTLLGGDVDNIREEFDARQWWTIWDQKGWGKHVINLGGEVGFIQSAGSGGVPIYDRYFVGGLGSIRGFQYRRVGPVDAPTGKQIGGDFKFLANAEYEAPVIKDILRGVLFIDAGTLERSPSNFGDMRAAVGAGIRLRIPMAGLQRIPLSLYFAAPIAKKSRDKGELISFTIGTGFEF